ncbi:MAG TPA: DUF3995 domain-containing protein [Ktedonobacterales bacterium]|jgi:hypothetical protein|nr:DUF3995 domain-containing protein [Ktedonobacterales bacterium]
MAQGKEAPLIAADQQPRDRSVRWLALAAFGWAVIFAALSFFWAAGGKTGLHPLEQAGGSGGIWVAANLLAGLLKLCLGVGALAMVGAWLPRALRRPLRIMIWLAGVGMLLYGILGLGSDILHVAGAIGADAATRHWFLIYLVLWDPWWMLGGALFTTLAWRMHPSRR